MPINGETDKNGVPVIKFNTRELTLIKSLVVGIITLAVATGGVLVQNATAHADFRGEIKLLRAEAVNNTERIDKNYELLWQIANDNRDWHDTGGG